MVGDLGGGDSGWWGGVGWDGMREENRGGDGGKEEKSCGGVEGTEKWRRGRGRGEGERRELPTFEGPL